MRDCGVKGCRDSYGMDIEMGFIYRITNKINGKVYIGQTIQDVRERWYRHKDPKSRCPKLRNAIQKYGADNFALDIICICFDDDLIRLEIEYIKKYDSYQNGYNATPGGEAVTVWTDDMRKAMSEKLTGRKRPELALKFKGVNAPMYGRKHTAEARERMRQNNIQTGRMKVNQFTIDGVFVKQYNSVTEAAKVVSVGKAAMSRACAVETSVCQGFRWKWDNPGAVAERPKKAVGRRDSFKGKKHTDETKMMLRQKSNWNGRKVDKFTLEGVFVRRFDCLKDAAKSVDVDVRSVRNVCDGKGAYSRRHLWRWASDSETPDDISPCTVDTSLVRG